MITFHNDHWVSPVLCELLYNTVPEKLHAPVIFHRSTQDAEDMERTRGRVWMHPDRRKVEIRLFSFLTDGRWEEFRIWKLLLWVCYHEFGHLATIPFCAHIENSTYDPNNSGPWRLVEKLADDWADCAMARLLRYDKRLCQPASLGAFMDAMIAERKYDFRRRVNRPHAQKGSAYSYLIQEWRKYKSGGQLSTGEVAREIMAYSYDTRLVRKLAADLAYPYVDKAGRKHMFFAYGDLPEIKRRFDRYKAINGPTPSELAYQAEREKKTKRQMELPF